MAPSTPASTKTIPAADASPSFSVSVASTPAEPAPAPQGDAQERKPRSVRSKKLTGSELVPRDPRDSGAFNASFGASSVSSGIAGTPIESDLITPVNEGLGGPSFSISLQRSSGSRTQAQPRAPAGPNIPLIPVQKAAATPQHADPSFTPRGGLNASMYRNMASPRDPYVVQSTPRQFVPMTPRAMAAAQANADLMQGHYARDLPLVSPPVITNMGGVQPSPLMPGATPRGVAATPRGVGATPLMTPRMTPRGAAACFVSPRMPGSHTPRDPPGSKSGDLKHSDAFAKANAEAEAPAIAAAVQQAMRKDSFTPRTDKDGSASPARRPSSSASPKRYGPASPLRLGSSSASPARERAAPPANVVAKNIPTLRLNSGPLAEEPAAAPTYEEVSMAAAHGATATGGSDTNGHVDAGDDPANQSQIYTLTAGYQSMDLPAAPVPAEDTRDEITKARDEANRAIAHANAIAEIVRKTTGMTSVCQLSYISKPRRVY